MNIEFLHEDKKTGKVTFLLKNAIPAFANVLRRAMIESVPTMAIHDIEFQKNTSVLYDELIAHRLGLVPLSTDLKGYTLPSTCKCKGEGCARCTLKLTLKAKGPGTVYASDIKSKDPKVKPVHGDMPIVTLLKGQELELEATATLGQGKQHVKWSPGLAWYVYEPIITVNNDSPKFAECKNKYPPQVFDKNGKIDKKLITGNLVDACDGVCPEVVKIEHNPENFLFSIEPWGQLTPKEIAQAAADMLLGSLQEFEEKLGK
jgi:DNA-directed RNA polymerase subunit D